MKASGRIAMIGFAFAASVLMAMPVGASGANESVNIKTAMDPPGGRLYKEARVPVQSLLEATVSVPDGQPTILPLKRTQIRYDTDMTFNPNNRVTPVCPDSKINSQTNLAVGVSFMVDLCPRSVVGTGVSSIYLARNIAAPLNDPQMVIFNAGRNQNGEARIKIYAYSKDTGTGILMNGSLTRRGFMNVFIPVLSFDSAVGYFRFDIPGTGMEVVDPREPDGFKTIRGLDPRYVQAKCSDGKWTTGSTFRLGERNPATGQDIGATSIVDAPAYNDSCQGLRGRPVLNRQRKSFPRQARRGARPMIRVTVRNRGTASARNVRLTASGGIRGQRRVANVPPGTVRTFSLRPRVVARKGTVTRAVVRVSSNGSSVGFTARIRVR